MEILRSDIESFRTEFFREALTGTIYSNCSIPSIRIDLLHSSKSV